MTSGFGLGRGRGRARGVSLVEQDVGAFCDEFKEVRLAGDGSKKRSQSEDSATTNRMGYVLPALRTRPSHIEDKQGTDGRVVNCLTNYIPIESSPEWTMFQYHVSFSPQIDSKNFRKYMIDEHKDIFGESPVFDGMILFMPHRLDVRYHAVTSKHPRTGETVAINIKLTNELAATSPQCLTVFNLCNRKSFEYLGYKQLGRHFYNPTENASIENHRIEIWPGIISGIRLHEDKLLLCCEMSHKILRTDSVLTFLLDLHQRYREQSREKAVQILVGTSVLTRYNNKTYRVDDILWDKHPNDRFNLSDGTEMSYIDYYAKQYNKNITQPMQPLLLSRSKNKGATGEQQNIYLVPELCSMTGLTDEMRENRRVMQDLAQYTRVSPDVRVRHSRAYVRNIQNNSGAFNIFNSWGLQLGTDLLNIKARQLSVEQLEFGRGRKVTPDESADWSRQCRTQPLRNAVNLNYHEWMLVFIERDANAAETFFKMVKQLGPPIGMEVGEPIIVQLDGDRNSDFLDKITTCLQKTPNLKMVVTMVPNDNKTRYDAIKKTCCLDYPVPSQVVRSTSLQKNTLSVCSKILLQMNCKLGGSLWGVQMPMKSAMVIGYDAYHDSTNKGMSVGAAVFSLDPTMTRWYSQCALHSESKQLVHNLAGFCRNGLQKYRENTGFYPDKIFLYRDGVGDGQIPIVFKEELPQITKAFSEIANYEPKLAFIIVTKRVNVRYFEKVNDNSFKNPPPGTVVDTGVTKPERYDFYLVPQSVRQGTVTPVSYNIIYDDTGLKPDHMQRLAYKMCHLYYNWQGTIRVPAPCQYAHKLAFLVGQSLHKPASNNLADKLFFL